MSHDGERQKLVGRQLMLCGVPKVRGAGGVLELGIYSPAEEKHKEQGLGEGWV